MIITIETHPDQLTPVLINDLGLLIPTGAVQTFTRRFECDMLRQSKDLVTLAFDLAFFDPMSFFNSTLIVNNIFDAQSSNPLFLLANLGGPFGGLYGASDSNQTTTTSTTYTSLLSMQATGVIAGHYLIIFTATIGNSGANNDTFVSVFVDGNQRTDTERKTDTINNGYRVVTTIVWEETVTGNNQTIEIRWRTTGGTATCVRRGFTLMSRTLSNGNSND